MEAGSEIHNSPHEWIAQKLSDPCNNPAMFNAKMPDGSIVDAEWAYAPPDWATKLAARGHQVIVSVWAIDRPELVAYRLGSGFKVASVTGSDQKQYAIFATSEHVVEAALAVLAPSAYVGRSNPFSMPLTRLLTPILKKKALQVAVRKGQTARSLPVAMVSIDSRSDLCVLVVQIPLDLQDDPAIVWIDSDPLAVGANVMMVGFPKYAGGKGLPITKDKQVTMKGGLQLRIGKITSVEERLRHKPVFGYETNIPIPPGFSGGPVFSIDGTPGQPMPLNAVGICMSDSNQAESAEQITVPGSSHIVGIQNLYGVMDPHPMMMDIWNRQPPGRVPDPPFGSYLTDVGKLRTQLSISYDVGLESFVVTRRP